MADSWFNQLGPEAFSPTSSEIPYPDFKGSLTTSWVMLSNLLSSISLSRCSSQHDPDVSHIALNEYLEILVELFPDADIEDIRERLIQSSAESRLFLVTESLLIIPSKGNRPTGQPNLDPSNMFRSRQYQNAVSTLLYVQDSFKEQYYIYIYILYLRKSVLSHI